MNAARVWPSRHHAISPADAAVEEAPRSGDLKTARLFGKLIGELSKKPHRRGRYCQAGAAKFRGMQRLDRNPAICRRTDNRTE
ncbi:MAG TPA: hypothetical protein VME47_09750 [Acetobacteraceae bacterium]|nr:hypothetical protein [Acetobacteraceae bacterium]